MKSSEKIFYWIRKFFLLRLSIAIIFFTLIFSLGIFFLSYSLKSPVIFEIAPQSALPGEALTISGDFFGDEKHDSYVEIGGLRLTEQSYPSWQNNQIIVILPVNIQDGLVYVFTKQGKSNPKIFTNKAALPVIVRSGLQSALPVIQNIQQKNASIGSLITLEGINFGHIRGNSAVYFSWNAEKNNHANTIAHAVPAQDKDFDYEEWTDTQISVRVPNGASSGNIFIHTEKGQSNYMPFEIKNMGLGTKKYVDKKTYVIEMSTEVTNITADTDSILVIRMPRPPITDNQKTVEISDARGNPLNKNLADTVVFQYELDKLNERKIQTGLTFIVSTNSIETQINSNLVKPYTDTSRLLYLQYTEANDIIFNDNAHLIAIADHIIQDEKNPYKQAKLLYEYVIDNFTFLQDNRDSDTNPLDLLTFPAGDAYDFTIFYVSLLRAIGIPAIPLSGILVDKTLTTQNHWWASFYIEDFGWIPVDIALGAGMEYDAFHAKTIPNRNYYFGNIDAQHIIFSYDINNVRKTLAESDTVYKPKNFALQTIWEESNKKNLNYTSFWINPRVAGIY
ncbi:MAG: transglutaminase domain-containing protein [Treponemataceae bacterium]